MALIPVMDIKEGKVVAGDQGDRESYSPVESRLVDSAEPEKVLEAFEEYYRFETVYIADIDSLEDQGDNFDVVRRLSESSDKEIMLDCGFSNYGDMDPEIFSAVDSFIVPTESLESFEELEKLQENAENTGIVVSIDLDGDGFVSRIDPGIDELLDRLDRTGIEDIIVLDVSQVGTGRGPSPKVMEIMDGMEHDFDVISGGGVRDRSDYRKFRDNGIDDVLVATSLHDRSFSREVG